MGASVKSDDDDAILCHINVTPLVDVVLVLLIVFMITIPSVVSKQSAIKVDLPTSSSSTDFDATMDLLPLKILVKKEDSGEIAMYVGEDRTSEEQLRQRVKNGKVNPKEAVQILGDKTIAYGEVVKVMDILNSLGLHKLNLITKTEK